MPNTDVNPEDFIALSLVAGAGRKTLHCARRLAARQQRPISAFFGLPMSELLSIATPGESSAAEALSRCGADERARATWLIATARDSGIGCLVAYTPAYPDYLARALGEQAPPVLFYQGAESLIDIPGAGIVGTRRPTREGTALAIDAASSFAREGIPVVSGGARGIDETAHQAAIRADGNTIVILPEGLHAYDPPPFLRKGLAGGQVLLISEFLPTDSWQTHRAMTRNRTIAACSSVLCVIEPRQKGGSMFTAEQALAGNRPVFYWGGACRDGALRSREGAYRLTDARGRLHSTALLHAAQNVAEPRPEQIGLFE